MAELRLGPLLRYTDGSCATVWVETDRPCTAEVRCADGARGTAHSFRIADHHYALVPVGGLTPARRRSTRCCSTARACGRRPTPASRPR